MSDKESIQSKGGKARKASLTAEQRSEIAKNAALAKWAYRPVSATHKGTFKKDFGIDVDCYVLGDHLKTAVISQLGMSKALGLSSGGKTFPRFLSTKAISTLAGETLLKKLSEPMKFQWVGTGEKSGITVYGYDVTLLIDLCHVIILAETKGLLDKRTVRVADQAHVILGASAKAGIKGLVYALAGYNPTTEEVISAFKLYVQEEAKKYEKEFPEELYIQWHRLYQIPVPARGKPWHFKHLTVRHVYGPLAQSNGKVLQLTRALKSASGNRKAKLFQFLSEVGTRALRFHLGRLVEMAEDSEDQAAYEKKILKRFGGQQEFDLIDISPAPTSSETSA